MPDNSTRSIRLMSALVVMLMAAACAGEQDADAYGSFEAIEVVVSAQTSGQVLEFAPVEGGMLERGALVAVIDTTQLVLEQAQLAAQQSAAAARRAQAAEELRALEVQRELALRDHERTQRLFAEQAATRQQLERTEQAYEVLLARIDAARALLRSAGLDVASAAASVRRVEDLVGRSGVLNPTQGTVLVTYTRVGETVQAGQPLYRVASLDTLILRVYVTADQLASVQLGSEVDVHFDGPGGLASRTGVVEWISPSAEFTPTPIQTRDERATLVYAVKVRVPNENGGVKIGMPGDVTFRDVGSGARAGQGGAQATGGDTVPQPAAGTAGGGVTP